MRKSTGEECTNDYASRELAVFTFHAKNKSKQNHIEYRLAKAQATCGQLE